MDGTKELSKTKGKGILLSKEMKRRKNRVSTKQRPYKLGKNGVNPIPTSTTTNAQELEMVRKQTENRLGILDCKMDFTTSLNLKMVNIIHYGRLGPIISVFELNNERTERIAKMYCTFAQDLQKTEYIAKQFMKEIDILSQLSHPNILSDVVPVRCPAYYIILMPYCTHRSIHQLISVSPQPPINILSRCILQLANVVKYIHSKGIYHGSIILKHLLVQEEFFEAKLFLTDFGNAKKLKRGNGLVTDGVAKIFSPFLAPEAKCHRVFDAFKVDMYAMGVSIWSIALWKDAYKYTTSQLVPTIDAWANEVDRDKKENSNVGTIVYEDRVRFKTIIENLLQPNPSRRWSIHDMRKFLKEECAAWMN